MLCRRADRGLLFGYFANKILSRYEEWREERDCFIPLTTSQFCTHIYIFFKLQRKLRHFLFPSLSHTHSLWLTPFPFYFFWNSAALVCPFKGWRGKGKTRFESEWKYFELWPICGPLILLWKSICIKITHWKGLETLTIYKNHIVLVLAYYMI